MVKTTKLFQCFDKLELVQISREGNEQVDALSKLLSSKDAKLFKIVHVELLSKSSVGQKEKKSYRYKTRLHGCKILSPIRG